MPLPLIPIGIGLLLGGSAWAGKKHIEKRRFTPERRMIFDTAMEKVKDIGKLNHLADVFEKEGLKAQATLLRKRARLRGLPQAQKDARREAMRKALASTDIAALKRFADALHSETAYANEAKIRSYIKTLESNSGAPQGV